MEVLKTEGLRKYYGSGENLVKALDGVDMSVKRGEFLAVVGTSGSGKSTLLHMLGGLDRPSGGKVYVDDKDISTLKDDALCIFRRRKIGFIFQSYNLVPVLNIYENIVLPIELDGNEVDKSYVNQVVEVLGLGSKLNCLPSQLSGGQQQRVAIGRALFTRPALILADEPTGNLDSQNTSEVIALLKEASKKYEQTIIMITHSRSIAQTADRILQVSDGELTDLGRCRE